MVHICHFHHSAGQLLEEPRRLKAEPTWSGCSPLNERAQGEKITTWKSELSEMVLRVCLVWNREFDGSYLKRPFSAQQIFFK